MANKGKLVSVGNIAAFYQKLKEKFMPNQTPQELRAAMGLGDTLGPLGVEYGGTGSSSGLGASDELGITNYNKGLFYIDTCDTVDVLIPRTSPIAGYTFTFIANYEEALARNWTSVIDENVGIIATPICGFNNANSSAKTLAVFFNVVTEDGALTTSVCEVSGSPTFGSNMGNAHDHYTTAAKRVDGGWQWHTLMVQRSSGTYYTVNGTATSIGHSLLVRITYTDDGVGTATYVGASNMTAITSFKTYGYPGTLLEVNGDFFLTNGYDNSSYLYTGLFRITSDLAATKVTSVGGTSLTGMLNANGSRYYPLYLQYDEELDLVILYDLYYSKASMFAFSPSYDRVYGMFSLAVANGSSLYYGGRFFTHVGSPVALGGLVSYSIMDVDSTSGYDLSLGLHLSRNYVDRETLQVVTQTARIPYIRGKATGELTSVTPSGEFQANAVLYDGGEWILSNWNQTYRVSPTVVSPDLAASVLMTNDTYSWFDQVPLIRQVGRSIVGVSVKSHYINNSSSDYRTFTMVKVDAAEKGKWINA